MARVELAPEVLDDMDRFVDHLQAFEVEAEAAAERISRIFDALKLLTHSPLVGRPLRGGLRELIIGRGATGYVALYRYVPDIDTAFVLAIRNQRESGFKPVR